jgi:hypothetical protein
LPAAPPRPPKNEWDPIELDGPYDYVLPTGETRTLEPSCSGGPTPSDTGQIVPADTQFFRS